MTDPIQFPAFSARMVRELKGAPLACLVLLMCANQPVQNEWLCMMSGYSDKPISQALNLLSSPEYQLARRARGGWIVARGVQLVLSGDESRKYSDSAMIQDDESRKYSESRNISDHTTTTSKELIKLNNTEVVTASRKNSDSATIVDFDEWDALFSANLEACRKAGINEPTASNISALEHVTPQFVADHVAGLTGGDRIGLAILRIKNNEPPPAAAPPEHTRNYSKSVWDQYFRPDEEQA